MDSVPSLLIRLGEAQRRITELEQATLVSDEPDELIREVIVEVPVEVFVTDPELVRVIDNLREQLAECRSTSQSGS